MKKGFFLFLLFVIVSRFLYAQASWEKYGQNRVQYRTFNWQYYDSTHFRTFYYDHGKANALYAINVAEQELTNILYLMGGGLPKKINIIIYNSFGDLRQTNIGRKNEETNDANGGKLDVMGDNIPIYFNGDHEQLKAQIRKGVAGKIKDNMLFGDNLKEVVKNAVKMNLPEWYTTGYVSYIADNWTAEKETELKALVSAKPSGHFLDFSMVNPNLVGHSFWHFISNQYGENNISNLLYLTRFRKTVNYALEAVLRKPAKDIFLEWESIYRQGLLDQKETPDSINGQKVFARIKTKPNASYSQFTISPNGREVAYVEKLDGQFAVKVFDTKYNKSYEVVNGGVRGAMELADPDYPMLSWSASGKKMAVLYQRKNMLNLRIFTSGKRAMENRYISPNKIERITGMCFMEDENSLAVAGIKKGQSNLYKLTIRNNRFEPISKDLFDDKNPVYVQNGLQHGILFLSNRSSNRINENNLSFKFTEQFNLFLYNPAKFPVLFQFGTLTGKIFYPMQWGAEEFCYLQEEGNHLVRKVLTIVKQASGEDSMMIKTAAPFDVSILKQEYLQTTGMVAELVKYKNEYLLTYTPHSILKSRDEAYWQQLAAKSESTLQVDKDTLISQETDEYITSVNDTTRVPSLESVFLNPSSIRSRYQNFSELLPSSKPKRYRSTFYPDFIQTSIDNTLLFTRYQPFEYNGGNYNNPPLSGFLTSSLTDIMEDYKLLGGIRFGSDFNSLDYFLSWSNFRKRTDWDLLYYHSGVTYLYDFRNGVVPYYSPYPVYGKVSTDYLQGSLSYPFDILQSIRLHLGLRYDKIRLKAKDKYSIGIPDDKNYWVVSRGEFVYDNTISPIQNIHKGSRAKLFIEYQYKMNDDTKGFYCFGYDARNYLTLYKNTILASRLAGSHSGGNAKVLFLMGGVDNDVDPKTDNTATIDYTQNYAFQSLATNMRGYRQGFRNGNSYMVVNEEIRFPIFNTLRKKPVKSNFLRNLQLIAFADIGSAWKGILPDDNNIQNIKKITEPNSAVTVYLDNSKYDFGIGYGLGLRSRLLGYFIRSDFAWNIEGIKKPMVHISLATDF